MKTILTGVKPTGVPHIGNYFGAIKPAIDSTNELRGAKSYLFIADYHALTTVKSAAEMNQYVREIACTWLACGLDIKKTVFYRQSDVPQIFELSTILTNVTPKGLMNRAHAYKAIVQAAIDRGVDPDVDVNMGLFTYPILMSADILAFDTDLVPVGRDQQQHVEITVDIAKAFNAVYGGSDDKKILTIPQPKIEKSVATIPGLDGRKMSKSYGNQIPLFANSNDLKKCIMRITTDSTAPTDPKPTDHPLFEMYKLFANPSEIEFMTNKFANGVGWGDVKTELFRVADRTITPMRERFEYYMNNYELVEKILADGAKSARKKATETLSRVRLAIGAL
ncbi:MAG: tryptophan--tRNA ligase [Firmicutes bacterium]|nr:tryptophan--tRNA ligase [Bacillota bacterium]